MPLTLPFLTLGCLCAGHYWIGRVVEAEGGFAGRGVLKQVTTRESINSTMFTAGDFAIALSDSIGRTRRMG